MVVVAVGTTLATVVVATDNKVVTAVAVAAAVGGSDGYRQSTPFILGAVRHFHSGYEKGSPGSRATSPFSSHSPCRILLYVYDYCRVRSGVTVNSFVPNSRPACHLWLVDY